MELREFRLSAPGRGLGVSCNANGAFLGSIPLLKRWDASGKSEWQPVDSEQLSSQVSTQFGLPINMSGKRGGLQAVANALNAGELARAQIATVLLGIPDPPQLLKGAAAPERTIKLIRDLHWSGMLKWDPDEHPRWPAGQSDGGQFRPVTGDTDSHTHSGQGSGPSGQRSGEVWSSAASIAAAGAVEVAGNIAIGAEEIGTGGAATPAVPAEETGLAALAGEAASVVAGAVESGGSEVVSEGAADYAEGSFSIGDWSGYPTSLSRPSGPFRLLNGDVYDAARAAANNANRALREANPAEYAGREIHEIQPVKFGGSPIDPANKVVLTPEDHSVVTTWWARLYRSIPR